MKKTYEKPAMSEVKLNYKSYLLVGSPVLSQFEDDPEYEEWDGDGGQ